RRHAVRNFKELRLTWETVEGAVIAEFLPVMGGVRKTIFGGLAVVAVFAAGPGIASFGTNPALTQLSGVAVLNRCAVQLTQGNLDPADPLIARVASGAITPADACIAVLDRAALMGPGGAEGGLATDTP